MDKENKVMAFWATLLIFLFTALIVSLAVGVNWYKAGIQADVYRREGIEITTWEVMMGAKPAERTINVKEKE